MSSQAKKISQLDEAEAATLADLLPVVQPDGRTRKVSIAQMRELIVLTLGTLNGDEIARLLDEALTPSGWRNGLDAPTQFSVTNSGERNEMYGTGTPGEAYLM